MNNLILLSEKQARKVFDLFLQSKYLEKLEFLDTVTKVDATVSDLNSYRFTSILQTVIVDIAYIAILVDAENGIFALYATVHYPFKAFEIGKTYVRELFFIRENDEDGMYVHHLFREEDLNERLKRVISNEFKYEFKN